MKKWTALLLAAMMLLSLAACSGDGGTNGTEPNGETQGNQDQPQDSGETKDTLYVALSADVMNLDPLLTSSATDNTVNYEIYDGLVKMSPDNVAEPWIATEWEISDDGMTYTFKLRDDVVFHNGEKLTSDDVVFSAERGLTSAYTASTFGLYCESAEAIDEYTVALHLKQPYAPFIGLLDTTLVIHSRAAWEQAEAQAAENGTTPEAEYLEHPIGTGPYMFVEHKIGESVTLKANPDHFAIVPEIPNVVYRVITDPSTISVAIETGEIDLAGYSSSVPAASLELLEENENLNVVYRDSISTSYITFNTETAPFDNRDLRLAVAYAIDKQFLIDVTENGHGSIATAMTNSLVFGHPENVEGYPYNVELAKQYLADAGYPDGQGLETLSLKVMEGKTKAAGEAVQNSLQQIGMNVEIELMEKNAFLSEVLGGNYTFAYLSIVLGTDAAYYSQIYTSPNINGLNSARINDPEIDAMFAAAETTNVESERIANYETVFERVQEECYYAPLYHMQNAYVHNKSIVLGELYPSTLYMYQVTLAD